MNRSRNSRNRSRQTSSSSPAIHVPKLGTKVLVTRRNSAKEKASVPTRDASTALSMRSRYQTRMYLAENEPVAIWTTSTVTVTTKPVKAAVAPTIAESTVLAVEVV